MSADTKAVASIAGKLKSILEQEPALRGAELEKAVSEKEALLRQLEEALGLDQAGAQGRVEGAAEFLLPLSYANGLALKFGRLRQQLGKIQNPGPRAVTAPRVDLIS